MDLLKKLLVSVFAFILLYQTNNAQKPWAKDWKTLDRKEALKIVNDSPWAKNYNDIEVSYSFTSLNKGAFEDGGQLGPAPPVVVRFYSSLKIREALLRLRQIGDNYDQMDEGGKKDYDEKTKDMLECDNCKNYYVIIVHQPIEEHFQKSIISYGFRDDKLADLQGKIYLENDKKQIRQLEQFGVPKTGTDPAVFYFTINDEKEQPLITKDTKKFSFKIRRGMFHGKGYMQDIDFDVAKMLVDGKLDF